MNSANGRLSFFFFVSISVHTRPSKVETAVHSCNSCFQFEFYHVVFPLSCLRSIILASFYFWLTRSFTDLLRSFASLHMFTLWFSRQTKWMKCAPWQLCCVLGQNILLAQTLSLPWCNNGYRLTRLRLDGGGKGAGAWVYELALHRRRGSWDKLPHDGNWLHCRL